MAPFVAALVTALAAVGIVLAVRRWARKDIQVAAVLNLQLAVFAMTQAAMQRFYAGQAPGGWTDVAHAEASWTTEDKRARPAVVRRMSEVHDEPLRQLAAHLMDRTARLLATGDRAEAGQLRDEVDALHQRFRARASEVLRTLRYRANLG